jgi:multidrug efflux pump subunit AcrA (membrane-fusion protein)
MKQLFFARLVVASLALLSNLACEKKNKEESREKNSMQSSPLKTEAGEMHENPKKERSGRAPALRSGPQSIRAVRAERAVGSRTLDVVAPLLGIKQADVYSKVTGRLTYIGPQEGQPVKAGDILFRIDRSDPGESFLSVPAVSPFTGWIGRWLVSRVGEQVTPSEPVVSVVDDRVLRATAFVSVQDWLTVTANTPVAVHFGGEKRSGRVVTIARAADSGSGRGSVTVEVDNPQRDWRSGIFAHLVFDVEPKERLLLGAGSLVITDQNAFVYVVEGEVVRKKTVSFVPFDADQVEILDGLVSGSLVVTEGSNLLGDGSLVQVID